MIHLNNVKNLPRFCTAQYADLLCLHIVAIADGYFGALVALKAGPHVGMQFLITRNAVRIRISISSREWLSFL